MTTTQRVSYLAAALWILAGLLAWTAVAVRYARRGEMNWAIAAAGLFLFAAGLSAWLRARQLPITSADDDRSRTPPA
jgi:hypothetical protein